MKRNSKRSRFNSLQGQPLTSPANQGSFNPNTLRTVLSCLIIILIGCNAFTLYLLNSTIYSSNNCDNESDSSTPKFDSIIEPKKHINQPQTPIINDRSQDPTPKEIIAKRRGNLPFVPIDPEIDRNNYQNPNPVSADDIINSQNTLSGRSNNKQNIDGSTLKSQNPLKKTKSDVSSNSDIESNDISNENSVKSDYKTGDDNERKGDGNGPLLMSGPWERNPNIPSRSEILEINKENQMNIMDNERLEKLITNKELWKINKMESNENEIFCDWRQEYILNNTISVLNNLKKSDYMPMTICPKEVSVGWRANYYVPFIHGSACEPWWHRDAVFIMSRLLNKNMKALEYGSGASTIWMAQFVKHVIAIERLKKWADGLRNLSSYLELDNIEIKEFNLGRKYVEIEFDDNPGGMTDWMRDDINNKGGIDFISVDGQLRYPCMEYAFKLIKPHGGIILLDNSDRPGNDGQNVTTIMPDHWLRYDSSNLQRHLERLPTLRWLENSQTTIYITRDKRCMI